MAAEDYEIDVRPEVVLMEQVLAPLTSGELRVPRFQRPFVWRPEQILALFDSIERGYPIGSLLFWQTSEHFESLDEIGKIPVPKHSRGRQTAYVLDGHQRLSALFGTLRRPAIQDPSTAQDDWMWRPYRVLGESGENSNRYRHWKQAGPPPLNYLPLRSVLRTIDFLAYARELSDHAAEGIDVDELTSEAELVIQRIRQYKLAVVRLVGGTLSNAVEVFSRVNSTGQAMRPAEMVSALTYRADGGPTLTDRLDGMIAMVADSGFGEISSDMLFQALLAISGEEDVQRANWDVLAQRVKGDVQEAADSTEEALERAVRFLRDNVGVPVARLVPYDAQLMLLTTFFHHCPVPSIAQVKDLTRWFWVTSWVGHFAGANTTDIKHALDEVRQFANGTAELPIPASRARPFPNRFDLRSARVRALLIWEQQHFDARKDADGKVIDSIEVFAKAPTFAYRQIIVRSGLAAASSPANRLILPTAPRQSVRKALLGLDREIRGDVLRSHGISDEAFALLQTGEEEAFIESRQTTLAELERSFMASFGVVSDAGNLVGDADIDTV
jgi:uncharacterized protein DUF262